MACGVCTTSTSWLRSPSISTWRTIRTREDNLYDSSPDEVAQLERQLVELMDRWQSHAPAAAERTMTTDEINRLAALGYVSGGEGPSSSEELPDPKEMMPFLNRVNRGLALLEMGRYAEVLPLAREVTEQCPDYVLAHHLLARTYVAMGRAPEAAAVLREFSLRRPNFETYVRLAQVLLELERYDELEEVLERAETLQPLDGMIPTLRPGHWISRTASTRPSLNTSEQSSLTPPATARRPAAEFAT